MVEKYEIQGNVIFAGQVMGEEKLNFWSNQKSLYS